MQSLEDTAGQAQPRRVTVAAAKASLAELAAPEGLGLEIRPTCQVSVAAGAPEENFVELSSEVWHSAPIFGPVLENRNVGPVPWGGALAPRGYCWSQFGVSACADVIDLSVHCCPRALWS